MKKLLVLAVAVFAIVVGIYYVASSESGFGTTKRPDDLTGDAGYVPVRVADVAEPPQHHMDYKPLAPEVRLAGRLTPEEAYAAAQTVVACTTALETPAPQELPPELAKVQQQAMIATLDCKNLNVDVSIYDLAKFAAESGNADAQLDFPALAAFAFGEEEAALDPELLKDYKQSSLRFLQSAAQNGKSEALQRLSESYQVGRFSERSPKLAYAYALAYARESGSTMAHRRAMELASSLGATEIAEAQRFAVGL